MAKRIDPSQLPPMVGTMYPPPYDAPCRARERTRLGDVAGLTQFGVNLLRLPPGAWSSQRHWHTAGDEFVYVISGEVTLVTDAGDEILGAGDAAGFKANDGNGHCLQNRSAADALVLEIGTRIGGDVAYYPGLDMVAAGRRQACRLHPHRRLALSRYQTPRSLTRASVPIVAEGGRPYHFRRLLQGSPPWVRSPNSTRRQTPRPPPRPPPRRRSRPTSFTSPPAPKRW